MVTIVHLLKWIMEGGPGHPHDSDQDISGHTGDSDISTLRHCSDIIPTLQKVEI